MTADEHLVTAEALEARAAVLTREVRRLRHQATDHRRAAAAARVLSTTPKEPTPCP